MRHNPNITGNAPKRTFLAIKIPLELAITLCKRAKCYLGPIDGLSWIAPQQQHITLKFLGNSWPQQLTALVDCLTRDLHSFQRFDCKTGAFLLLPNDRKPRVLSLKIHTETALTRLANLCEHSAVSCDYIASTREFRPHITLGRFKQTSHYHQFFNLPNLHLSINEMRLLESVNRSSGVYYRTLHIFPLRPCGILPKITPF